MEFFDDTSEIDQHIQNLKGYIDSGDWDEVKSEVMAFVRVIKSELKSLPQGDFHILSGCKKISDILDIKRHLNVYGTEEFSKALLSLFRMQETLSWDQPFDDKDQVKQDFYTEVDQIQRYLEKIILIFAMPEKWGLEKKYEKSTKGLKKGAYTLKSLESLNACIIEILNEKGSDIKPKVIIDKLKKYTDDEPYRYKHFILKYDSESETFFQINDKTGKEDPKPLHQVYSYITRNKKKYK